MCNCMFNFCFRELPTCIAVFHYFCECFKWRIKVFFNCDINSIYYWLQPLVFCLPCHESYLVHQTTPNCKMVSISEYAKTYMCSLKTFKTILTQVCGLLFMSTSNYTGSLNKNEWLQNCKYRTLK